MKISKSKFKVAIIGAGLSGLAAAYEIVKTKYADITIFESAKTVGGRVKSVKVDGAYVDVGGFIIYPWYTNYHRIINELKLKSGLKKIKGVNIYYQLDSDGPYFAENKLPVPIGQKLQFGTKMLSAWLRHRPDFRSPDINYFDNKTIAEILNTTNTKSEILAKFIDVVNQGYCYAGLDDFQMSFYAPFVYQTLVKGDLRTGAFFEGNNQLFPQAMADFIEKNGGKIELNSKVTQVSNQIITTANKRKQKFDAIIFANQVGNVYKDIIKAPAFEYTHFYALIVSLSQPLIINADEKWTAVFTAVLKDKASQITSVIRAEGMVPALKPGYLIINYKVADKKIIPTKLLANQIRSELSRLFPGCKLKKIIHAIPWIETMPIASAEFVNEVRQKNGNNNYYFAGDYLGAPSMETAISSGVTAANLLLKKLGHIF